MHVTSQFTHTIMPDPEGGQTSVRRDWISLLLACGLFASSATMASDGTSPLSRNSQIDSYLDAIEQAETDNGPYTIELVDLYYGFGQALLETGDLEAALDAFQQTAMIARVNHGPNSLDQTNYLYSVAKVESLLGNLEPSVRVLEYIYQIHARAYGEYDPAMLPVLEQLSEWYTQEKPLGSLPFRSTDYQNESFFAARIAPLTAAQYGLGSTEAAQAFRNQGQVHFRSIFYMFRSGEPPIPELVINAGASTNPWVVERSISNHFRAGEEAYENAVQAWMYNPEATSLEVAEAIAQLGDWYLVLEQFRTAGKEYQRAFQMLSANGENLALADEYFGTPTPLRFLSTDESFVRSFDEPVASDGLEVVMTVTRNGRLTDVEFRNVPAHESQEEIETVRRRLERTRFRPAMQMGKVIEMVNYVWRPPPVAPRIAARDGG
jgi:tetratricopeptide (TPR) repeat protein